MISSRTDIIWRLKHTLTTAVTFRRKFPFIRQPQKYDRFIRQNPENCWLYIEVTKQSWYVGNKQFQGALAQILLYTVFLFGASKYTVPMASWKPEWTALPPVSILLLYFSTHLCNATFSSVSKLLHPSHKRLSDANSKFNLFCNVTD